MGRLLTTIPVRMRNFSRLQIFVNSGPSTSNRTAKTSRSPGSISARRADPLEPNLISDRRYGVCTVLIPALGTRLVRNGAQARGDLAAETRGTAFLDVALAFWGSGPRRSKARECAVGIPRLLIEGHAYPRAWP